MDLTWDPGNGSDVVEGEGGTDTLQFNGAGVGENIAISANGQRVSFFRDVANINMDLNGVERIVFDALGGADRISVGDLTGTYAAEIRINLGGKPGTTLGDGSADTVSLRGGVAAETIRITNSASGVLTTGLKSDVSITGSESSSDRLEVFAGAGNDTLDASATFNESSSACSVKPAMTGSSAARARTSSMAAPASTPYPWVAAMTASSGIPATVAMSSTARLALTRTSSTAPTARRISACSPVW